MTRVEPAKKKWINKKLLFFFALIGIILIKDLLSCPIPSIKNPLLFFCNQSRKDIKRSFIKTLQNAKHRIWISVYTLTDKEIIACLNKKADEDLIIELLIDKKQLKLVQNKLSNKIKITTVKQKGLMHQKIFVIDDLCFLGSTNLTTSSLRMHDNLMVGLYSPLFASYLTSQINTINPPSLFDPSHDFEFYPLPSLKALQRVVELINSAQSSIHVAMFTFTHQEIAEALINAQKRGVCVKVILDTLSSKGASKQIAQLLKGHHLFVATNRGTQLMHHKMAWIDNEILILGSTNWTKSAFLKNQDGLMVLPIHKQKEKQFISNLFENLEWESQPY